MVTVDALLLYFVLGFPLALGSKAKPSPGTFTRRRRDSVPISLLKKINRKVYTLPIVDPLPRPPCFDGGILLVCRCGDALDCDTYQDNSCKGHLPCAAFAVWLDMFPPPVHVPARGRQWKGAARRM